MNVNKNVLSLCVAYSLEGDDDTYQSFQHTKHPDETSTLSNFFTMFTTGTANSLKGKRTEC